MTTTRTLPTEPNPPKGPTMSDLRAMLGDRYKPVIQAAVLADNPEAITNAQRVGGDLGQLMYLSAADRLARVLTAVLPDLLAQAWDEGHRASERDWEMVYDLSTPDEDRQPWTNPYRQENGRG